LIHVFLTSEQVGGKWLVSRSGPFTSGERSPATPWIGGWVGPRAGLDDVKRRNILSLPGLEIRPLGDTSHSLPLSHRVALHVLLGLKRKLHDPLI
jgi:hypothetical protein